MKTLSEQLDNITVEDDVPIPRQQYKKSTMKDKVAHVKVGQSFLVDYAGSGASYAGNLARATGWDWVQRRDEKDPTKMRIWRIE